MSDWREHSWAIGREEMLEKKTEAERWEWLHAREEEDRIWVRWARGLDPDYPIPDCLRNEPYLADLFR